ncbi:phosphohistidine phosphatase SixA [Colwelliaceae bacterium 6471]
MHIFIMRHGDAQQSGYQDSQRELTQRGIVEVSAMATRLQHASTKIDHVLISPYKRAQQTASIVLSALPYEPTTSTIDLITPSGSPSHVHDYIDGMQGIKQLNGLLIISHMPLVSFLVAELTYEKSAPIFQTAAIAEIDYDLEKMKGHLSEITSPNHFE